MEVRRSKFSIFKWCVDCFDSNIEDYPECCNNAVYHYVRHKISNGVFTLKKQCVNCNHMLPQAIKRKTVENFEALPLSVERTVSSEKWETIKKFKEYISTMIKKQYADSYAIYRQSKQWRDKRDKAMKRDNYLCQGCLTNKATVAHHTTYDNVGDELLFQLISLCETCHSKVHHK